MAEHIHVLQMRMSKLSLKVLLGVFALMFSASVGLSAECKDDPNECTPKNLCEVATQVINDNKVWSKDASAAEHLAFAKELGMECGVVEITDPCDLDPNECKVKQLCEKATTGDDGSESWNAEAEAYVELAKEYGLECGVGIKETASGSSKCSINTLEQCSAKALCTIATKKGVGVNRWRLKSSPYRTEAKKRGLSCGVGEAQKTEKSNSCQNNPKVCITEKLCEFAAIKNHNKNAYYWRKASFPNHVKEAKKRGLSCGVEEIVSQDGTCEWRDFGNCTDKELCEEATETNISGKTYWEKHGHMIYVKEAQRRGLSCSVGERVRTFKYSVSDQELARHFKRFAMSERKRIQYVLKELGFYSKAIDGLWGEGTRTAFKNYGKNLVLEYDIDEPSRVIDILLREVNDYPNYGTCAEDVSLCSANYVCKRINNNKYNNEAIRRNLSCAVKKSYSSTSSSTSSSNSSSTYSNNAGLTAIVSNPSMSGEQAMAICKPQAKLAYNNVVNSDDSDRRNRDYGSTTRCTSFTRYSMNCNTTSNSGGPSNAMQGILLGLTVGLKAKRVAETVLESCLAQYGWKK